MTESSKPPPGRRMKAHAPPPPQVPQPAPRKIFRQPVSDGGGTSGTDVKENMLKRTVELKLTLPHGHQTSVIEDGSKALMDLLVELCSRYHLNPALHTLELLSPEGHSLGFKPNALLGSLNVASVFIKEKVWEEKVVRRPAPKVPEKTVRLMVNFHGSQKAVVRVNPLVPLKALIPVICDKCEFEPSHVLLLKDGVSRYELPLDKSLTDLGIKELYVHDQTLDSTYSSTTSLGIPEKKGFLGALKFSRRKSKTDSTSKDMDDCDDKIIQNTGMHSDTLSTVSGIPCLEVRTGTLGTSQSEMNIPRMSPKADHKKRRAPAPPGGPTHSMGHTNYESVQVALSSESQQRKRKAPAPPPTPTSISQVSDEASASAASTPDSFETETPTPALFIRVAQSASVYAPTAVTQTAKPAPIKVAVKPLHVYDAIPAHNSPTPSSSTADSLTAQDSSSELSHSLDDSDADLDQSGSQCSTLTSSSASESMRVVTTTTTERLSMKVEKSVSGVTAQSIEEKASDSNPRLESESALNVKLDEMENNRHSTMAWLRTAQRSAAEGQKPTTEDETLSLSSSSGSSSLPDQGYAASEGMTEGEDSRVVSSLSDTQPNSPEESLSLDGSGMSKGEKLPGTLQDSFQDIDEGCATWGSIHRHSESAGLRNHDDCELTVQLHQTLADFEADLADHFDTVSTKDSTYTVFMDSNEVPVSVVDIDVPVTAIDDVLEEYEHHTVEHKVKSLTRTESTGSTDSDSHQKPIVEPQNKNNNAYTTAISDKKSTVNVKQLTQSEHSSKRQENKSISVDKEEKVWSKMTKSAATHAKKVKEDVQKSAVKSDGDMQKKNNNTEYSLNPMTSNAQKQTTFPSQIQTSVSAKKEENTYQNTSCSAAAQSKITRNVTSRFGMKTFTVVPPKPVVVHADSDQSAARTTIGAIRIDDQGNMVSWNKNRGSSESENTWSKDSTVGKAKTFWSSSEIQEGVHSKRLFEKPKESVNNVTCGAEHHTATQSALSKIPERVQSEMIVKEVAEVPVEDVKAAKREQFGAGSKISVSKSIQPPSNKPVVPSTQLPDLSKDLSFLKPSRRTSSQYVASAISKYAPTSSGKSGSIPKSPDYSSGFQRLGRSIQVNPHQSSQSIFSENKENVSVFPSALSKTSMSFPEFMSESQRDFEEARRERTERENRVVSIKESSQWVEKDGGKNFQVQINGTKQTRATNHNDGDQIRHSRPRSPSPAGTGFRQSSTKPSTVPKILYQGQTNSLTHRTMVTPRPSSDLKPQPPVTVTDSGVTSGSSAVTLFGPTTKFKPVIQKAAEKETSLHSSLMEAIQTGGGKERLKKTSTSETRSLKKEPYVEEETERSALLAAIRAQNSTGRLKKIKSKAANELEKFRKVASEEESHLGSSSSSSLTCTSLVFNSPPPPAAMTAPPPPPLVLPQAKARSVANPNTNTPMNPALAREAMLDAIRSGSAADKLKKVAAPVKTIQVNGRLGTIQATSSTTPM